CEPRPSRSRASAARSFRHRVRPRDVLAGAAARVRPDRHPAVVRRRSRGRLCTSAGRCRHRARLDLAQARREPDRRRAAAEACEPDMPLRAVRLLMVFVAGKALGSVGHHVATTWWSPIAYFWQDALVALAFAALEILCRARTRLLWTLYVVLAVYAVLNIPVQRTLWSPLTWPMLRAAGGPLADSIRYYATWSNAALVAVGLVVMALAPTVC